jgi:hypothetical protein
MGVKAQGGRQALGTICQTEEEERGFRPRKMKGEGCPENTPWGAPTVLLLPRAPKGSLRVGAAALGFCPSLL